MTKATAQMGGLTREVVEMVKRLEECAKFCDRTDMRSFAVICRDAAALLEKLVQTQPDENPPPPERP